jgi:hypothetical protein
MGSCFPQFLALFLDPSLRVSFSTLLFPGIIVFICSHSLQDCGPLPPIVSSGISSFNFHRNFFLSLSILKILVADHF